MKYDVQLCEVLRRAQTAENTFDYTVLAPKLAEVAQPGQFAHIYVPGKTLRRPISICDIDKKNGTLRFVFQIRGAGTEQLSKFEVGDKMDIFGAPRPRLYVRPERAQFVHRRRYRCASAFRCSKAMRQKRHGGGRFPQ